MTVKLLIHSTGAGTCSLTGKEESDGLTVTFEDGTVKDSFLSWKAFRQLLGLKAGQGVPLAKPTPAAVSTGGAPVK
jgi:hypothetical protein